MLLILIESVIVVARAASPTPVPIKSIPGFFLWRCMSVGRSVGGGWRSQLNNHHQAPPFFDTITTTPPLKCKQTIKKNVPTSQFFFFSFARYSRGVPPSSLYIALVRFPSYFRTRQRHTEWEQEIHIVNFVHSHPQIIGKPKHMDLCISLPSSPSFSLLSQMRRWRASICWWQRREFAN